MKIYHFQDVTCVIASRVPSILPMFVDLICKETSIYY